MNMYAAALTAALSVFSFGPAAQAQTPPKGVNVGSLTCTVAGGVGFVFGSSKDLDCILAKTDGTADHYTGTIKKYGVDLGFTKQGHVVWLVFAPGQVAKGALAGDYVGPTASASAGVGAGANVLIGGGNKQVSLQPVSVEGNVGLNVAAGLAEVTLKAAK
ncbi:DUF992 domain-containing protein [Reyranella sp.]|jgi:hypothetical protein|uniref:DUF992 domain-containing protein n=1 Tax=Reyranella sp. TaxID=1929291 RepID=UPI003BA9D621